MTEQTIIALVKLLDKTSVVGEVVSENEAYMEIKNAVVLASSPISITEFRYFFSGMHNPFPKASPIISRIYKDHVIAYYDELDHSLIVHREKFIKQWFERRKPIQTEEEVELEAHSIDREALEELEAYLEIKNLANTEIH
jgi:hypothetical protein|tara:strand:+ start:282 stop:701 length:420 start_codon:yes stop_codon:yes gene_type:complete